MRMTTVILLFCCFICQLPARERPEDVGAPSLPLAKGEDYFILKLGGSVIHVDRKTGASTILCWSGEYQDTRSRAIRKYRNQVMDAKADAERVYVLSWHSSRDAEPMMALTVFWQKDGSALATHRVTVRSDQTTTPAAGEILVASKSRVPEGGSIQLRDNGIELWGAKLSFEGKTTTKIEHAPELEKAK